MYYRRIAERLTISYLDQFRLVGIMGPRQSGKSTMIRNLLQDKYQYLTFDALSLREHFFTQPQDFLRQYNRHIIFDEVQQVPELFPALKILVDENPQDKGRIVLTGSGQFLLSRNISESLAGRIGLVSLLPFQYNECTVSMQDKFLYTGGYPEVITGTFSEPHAYFNSYLNTYIQKDLRNMLNVSDLNAFTLFLRLLASRATQILNMSDIAKETGYSVTTLTRWLSILEASYIIFLLRPFYNNLGKRLVKSPKIYFYDNGLLAFLRGITASTVHSEQDSAGVFFENFVISEVRKNLFHKGIFAEIFYIRTSHGEEIDLVLDFKNSVQLLEIKYSQNYKPQFHKTLEKLSQQGWSKNVVYQGETHHPVTGVKAWNFNDYFKEEM
ncbi:MAG: ATP-binding protein [Bacteroidales bacterium]